MRRFLVILLLACGAAWWAPGQAQAACAFNCGVESGRYYENEPVGPNNISNVRGVKVRMLRLNSGGIGDTFWAKSYVSVISGSGSSEKWIEFGVIRGHDPYDVGGEFDHCANTPNTALGDAYPTSRVYAEWYDESLGAASHGCLYGQDVTDNEAHDYRLERCGTGADWCTYLDGSLLWNTTDWAGFSIPGEEADEVRLAAEFNCNNQLGNTCHGSAAVWDWRYGGSTNFSVTNERAEANPSWWNEHYVAGEAAKANTPAGYWTIQNISTTAFWRIYHISV